MTCLDQALSSRPASLKTTPLLIALQLGLSPAAALADQVVSVGDGDTLSVMRGGRRVIVRLACIDAPESRQHPYGAQARSALQQLAPIGSEVSLRVQTSEQSAVQHRSDWCYQQSRYHFFSICTSLFADKLERSAT